MSPAMARWLALLSPFDFRIVNRAIVEFGINEDPFPEIGKIITICERIAAGGTTYSTAGGPVKTWEAPKPEVVRAAKALRLDIGLR